jgi:hypothetical protein
VSAARASFSVAASVLIIDKRHLLLAVEAFTHDGQPSFDLEASPSESVDQAIPVDTRRFAPHVATERLGELRGCRGDTNERCIVPASAVDAFLVPATRLSARRIKQEDFRHALIRAPMTRDLQDDPDTGGIKPSILSGQHGLFLIENHSLRSAA